MRAEIKIFGDDSLFRTINERRCRYYYINLNLLNFKLSWEISYSILTRKRFVYVIL